MRQAQESPDLDKEEKEGRCSEGGVRRGRRQGTVDRVLRERGTTAAAVMTEYMKLAWE